jgi:hypothetical protein
MLNWFGDSLDGTLARVRDCQRPRYGFYVDHILDAIGMSVLMTGMAFSGYISPVVAGVFLLVYLLLSIEIYLATYTIGTFHLSYWSFGPTELRILPDRGKSVCAAAGGRGDSGAFVSSVRYWFCDWSVRAGGYSGAGIGEAHARIVF